MDVTRQAVTHVRNILERLQLADMLAISGGADSMALAYAVSRAVGPNKCYALTVDHGFRSESSREAKDVSRLMQHLGITHEIRRLDWDGTGSSKGNTTSLPPVQRLEEIARERRYAEIAGVCHKHGIGAVLTGHHAGDQAETFLLRLLRQSGIYGMAGMALQTPLIAAAPREWPSTTMPAVIVRPLLQFKKEALYEICKTQGIRWHEDASNKDARFRRNQLRQLIGAKSKDPKSPFNVDSLLRMCDIMQGHREYINQEVGRHLASSAKFDTSSGTVELAATDGKRGLPLWATNAAVRERVLADVVSWINCKGHPPELAHLQQFSKALDSYCRQPSVAAAAVSAAGVTAISPSSRRGWLFCRQAPRPGEIAPHEELALGSSVVWDKRLIVSASWLGNQLPGSATWCLYSLDDAMRRWHGQISEHRNQLKRARKRLEPHMVQVTQPVVCIRIADTSSAQTYPVLALGHVLESRPEMAASGIDIAIRALGKVGSAANEIVR
ncbi:hypothetical protein GGH93_004072 [Coemansia aciculifera]|nr:hypothetical protein GGH93_004072 [Coemansia aciculifera]